MKNYKIILSILLFTFIYTSCKQTDIKGEFCPDLLVESVDTLYYSTFVDSIKYIHLETSEECLIGEISDAILTSNNIFIFDKYKQVIWIFGKHSVNHVFFPQTSVINFTSKKQSYDDTRRSSRDNELLQRAQSDL